MQLGSRPLQWAADGGSIETMSYLLDHCGSCSNDRDMVSRRLNIHTYIHTYCNYNTYLYVLRVHKFCYYHHSYLYIRIQTSLTHM